MKLVKSCEWLPQPVQDYKPIPLPFKEYSPKFWVGFGQTQGPRQVRGIIGRLHLNWKCIVRPCLE